MEIRETVITGVAGDDVRPWPVSWSAVWVGALATLGAITVFGLYSTALGVGSLGGVHDLSTWTEIHLGDLVSAVAGVFFCSVIGGWVAGKITGARYAEPAMLHGAISWLATIPALLVFLALGIGKTFGGWYGGIAGAMSSGTAAAVVLSPEAIRHSATAAATILLLGLVGSVLGGWLASGEPMSLTHYKTRTITTRKSK